MASIREVFILSLVARHPTYGYEIKQFMADALVESWTNISTTYIYQTLAKLGKAGLIEARSERVGLQPTRDIYAITPKGEKTLSEWVKQDEILDQKIYFNFSVVLTALAGMRTMPDQEKIQVIKRRIEIVKNNLRRIKEDREKGIVSKFEDTLMVQEIERHDNEFLEFELKWLERILEQVEQLGWRAWAGRNRKPARTDSLVGSTASLDNVSR